MNPKQMGLAPNRIWKDSLTNNPNFINKHIEAFRIFQNHIEIKFPNLKIPLSLVQFVRSIKQHHIILDHQSPIPHYLPLTTNALVSSDASSEHPLSTRGSKKNQGRETNV